MNNSIQRLEDHIGLTPSASQLQNKADQVYDKVVEVAVEHIAYAPPDRESIGVTADEEFGDRYSHLKKVLQPFEEPSVTNFLDLAQQINEIRGVKGALSNASVEQSSLALDYLSEWESEAISGFKEDYLSKFSTIVRNNRMIVGNLSHVTCAAGIIHCIAKIDAFNVANVTLNALDAIKYYDPCNWEVPLAIAAAAAGILAAVPSGGTTLVAALTAAAATASKLDSDLESDPLTAGESPSLGELITAYTSGLVRIQNEIDVAEGILSKAMENDIDYLSAAKNRVHFVGSVSSISKSSWKDVDNTIRPNE